MNRPSITIAMVLIAHSGSCFHFWQGPRKWHNDIWVRLGFRVAHSYAAAFAGTTVAETQYETKTFYNVFWLTRAPVSGREWPFDFLSKKFVMLKVFILTKTAAETDHKKYFHCRNRSFKKIWHKTEAVYCWWPKLFIWNFSQEKNHYLKMFIKKFQSAEIVEIKQSKFFFSFYFATR